MFSLAFPQTQVKELFQKYDSDEDNNLSLNELVSLLEDIGTKITALPAVCKLHHSQHVVNEQRTDRPSKLSAR